MEKIIQENAVKQKKKKPGLKFNPGLSANRPSNNGEWALEFCVRVASILQMSN